MNRLIPLLIRSATAMLFLCATASFAVAGPARNVIIMVPDGMGLADVTAARIYSHGPNGAPLSFETLKHIGYQRTHSADSIITDSAAAASAWACGEKYDNGEICRHADGRPSMPSVMELAKKSGKATGLVATSAINDATPAAFGAHVSSRDCGQEIVRQYIEVTRVDLLLGGGLAEFKTEKGDPCGTKGDFLQAAKAGGYTVVYDTARMNRAAAAGAVKVLGLFSRGDMTPECLRTSSLVEPRLPEMTAAALKVLEKDREGFFLMIEGSLVDKANHRNDYRRQLGEILAFDEAVAVVRAWIGSDRERKAGTLLIVVPDHETGGFAITGPSSMPPGAGLQLETGWTGNGHTAVDTIIWSEGPGSEKLAGAVDSTDLYEVMAEALR